MGYQQALEAAGATVVDFREFGSYQGDWFAILDNGNIVSGGYGSCSGCDAYQAEFDYTEGPYKDDETGKFYKERWDYEEITESEYNERLSAIQKKLSDFGQGYLNGAETLDECTARYQRKVDDEYAWDDDKEILEWLKSLKQESPKTI